MALAERLRELRAHKQVSLQTVADTLNVSKPHVWELEKGKTKNPSLELLKELASFYNVSLDYLAGVGGNETNDPRYSALLRKIDPENMSESDWNVIEQAMDFAVNVIKQNKKEVDD